MFEFIFGLAVVVASGLLGFKGDRWLGAGGTAGDQGVGTADGSVEIYAELKAIRVG